MTLHLATGITHNNAFMPDCRNSKVKANIIIIYYYIGHHRWDFPVPRNYLKADCNIVANKLLNSGSLPTRDDVRSAIIIFLPS